MEQEDKAAAGVYKIIEQQQDIRKRRVSGTRRHSSSRGYKREQEDRAAARIIR